MKSKFVKIAALFMVAVLASSCVLSSTLAYYYSETTEKTATVTVAQWKWGEVSLGDATIKPDNAKVAPGMIGSASFVISNAPTSTAAPEVNYEYGWIVDIDSAAIADLRFGVSEDAVTYTGEDLMDYIIDNCKHPKNAGEAPATDDLTLVIYWSWADPTDNEGKTDMSKIDFNANIKINAKFYAKQATATSHIQGGGD